MLTTRYLEIYVYAVGANILCWCSFNLFDQEFECGVNQSNIEVGQLKIAHNNNITSQIILQSSVIIMRSYGLLRFLFRYRIPSIGISRFNRRVSLNLFAHITNYAVILYLRMELTG